MNVNWYEVTDASVPLTQGDLIFDCPVITWNSAAVSKVPGITEGERSARQSPPFASMLW